MTAGGEALASSVTSAMEGVFVCGVRFGSQLFRLTVSQMKPIEGAESEGAIGFLKGVGKGLVGWVTNIYQSGIFSYNGISAVTKPVVGVFDLASNVSEGNSFPPPRLCILTPFRDKKYHHGV